MKWCPKSKFARKGSGEHECWNFLKRIIIRDPTVPSRVWNIGAFKGKIHILLSHYAAPREFFLEQQV